MVRLPVTVTPILNLDNGVARSLPAITLAPRANADLDINSIAAANGIPTNSQGSITFKYTGVGNSLAAETSIIRKQ